VARVEGERRKGFRGGLRRSSGHGVGGGVPGRGERRASSVWGGAERGGAVTRGGEAKWGEEGCRGKLGRGGVKGGRTGVGGALSRRRRRGVLALEHGTVRAGEHSSAARGQRLGREQGGVAGRRGSNGAAALVARVPCGRAAASGVQARAHSSGARQCGAAGQRARQRRSEPAAAVQRAHARPRSSVCARAEREGPAGKRERREKESGERKPKVNRLT